MIKTIGSLIKHYRKDTGFSQTRLSKKCKIAQAYLSDIENGLKIPSYKTVKKIIKFLGIPRGEVDFHVAFDLLEQWKKRS